MLLKILFLQMTYYCHKTLRPIMVYQKKMSKSPLKSNPIVNVVPTKSGVTVLNQNHEEQVLDPTEMTYLK